MEMQKRSLGSQPSLVSQPITVTSNTDNNAGLSETYLKCMQESTVGVFPEDKGAMNAYEVYKSSPETRLMKSEADKRIYADALIHPPGFAPLWYLCGKVLSQMYEPNELIDLVKNDPIIMRSYYETLSLDLPLEKCYYIDDESYWKRYVLTRHNDPGLQVKKIDWKNKGITMKFEKYLQQLSVGGFDEVEMESLSDKIKFYVTDLHIERLRSIDERTLLKHVRRDDICSSSGSSTTIPSSDVGAEEQLEAEEEDTASRSGGSRNSSMRSSQSGSNKHVTLIPIVSQPMHTIRGLSSITSVYSTWNYNSRSITSLWYDGDDTEFEDKLIRKEKRTAQRLRRQKRAECKEGKRIAEERTKVEAEAAAKAAEEKEAKERLAKRRAARQKKKGDDEMISVFDMKVEPPEEEEDIIALNALNKDKIRQLQVAMRDPAIADFCHHVDLRLLKYFPYLNTLRIEFNGPPPPAKYEDWHYHISTRDIERLAEGLRSLGGLQVFRLRNSRLNAHKLFLLTRSLKTIHSLKIVDFSYDNLKDDCGEGLHELFQRTTSIVSLDLTGNELGAEAICDLARALGGYDGCCQYLSLAHSTLNTDALNLFCLHIANTDQVRELCLRGAIISQEGIKNCIAQQLIPYHRVLRAIDMSGVIIDTDVACEILKSFRNNYKIRRFDVRGCDLPAELEVDFEILVNRNKFLFIYPAIGDTRISITDIDQSLKKTRNKILLRAIEAVEARDECLKLRPNLFHRGSEAPSSIFDFHLEQLNDEEKEEEEGGAEAELYEEESLSSTTKFHTEDPNKFNKHEIMSRFWYFDIPRGPHPNY
ncbi:uncharacterized protein LOC120771593 [Bactrocera tryoni]|uniref:uncharacterized protein LOC120771593 n=1 Tax=Bactrocera tryoni TaxID=59916 RepID=UPI001A9607B5|nr:uncharacterized protein LOC120771593 [Bactrocera tryoni]